MPANKPAPFAYPAAPHVWKHGPEGYDDYESFRSWVRDEFEYRCVFCLLRECWFPRHTFHLDHQVPQRVAPTSRNEYQNLRYACSSCNSSKSGKLLPCPLNALTAESVKVHADGTIVGVTRDAQILIEKLGLDSDEAVEFRRLMIRNVELAYEHKRQHYEDLMGYPKILPNLIRATPPP